MNDLSRDDVQRFEAHMLSMPQIEIPTAHDFCDGMYARSIKIPKGAIISGYIHKKDNLNICAKGKIAIYNPDLGSVRVFEAGDIIVSPPGTKRVGYAHEDSVWVTILKTEETDIRVIESLYLTREYDKIIE